MDELIQNAQRDLRTRARLVSASANPDDKVAGQQELQYEQAAIEKLRTLQVTGRIVLELKPTDYQVSDLPAIALEDGDRLIIPAKPSTVGVVGAVYNQNSFLYQEHNTVSTYLAYAGGGTRDADGGRVFVVRANGSVVSKQMHRSIWSGNFENTRLFAGDAIVVPEKVKTTNVLRGLRDWSQVFGNLALGVAALKTISP
jgi:protein involved in polysaccharide export with SLBB domain